ncbi:hypothetical protein cmbei_7001355 [Cryptosporidium meleagridis]
MPKTAHDFSLLGILKAHIVVGRRMESSKSVLPFTECNLSIQVNNQRNEKVVYLALRNCTQLYVL